MSQIKKGTTDVTRYILLVDSAAGTPETGYTITNLDLTYVRNRATSSKTDATALGSVDAAHADNQAIEVDGTNCPGLYRIDWPDAAFASGVDKVLLVVNGSGLHPAVEEITLVDNVAGELVDDAITASKIAADAITSSELAASAVNEIRDAILADSTAFNGADVAAIKAKTDNLPTDPADQSLIIAATEAIVADTEDIQSRLPAALVSGRMDCDVGAKTGNVALSSQEKTDVNAEVDSALNTAIPGSPTADSINQRIKALDDLAQAAGDGDLAAIKAKTDNLPVDPADQSLIIAATEAIVADTEDIQSRLPAALVGGRMDCDIGAKTGNVALSSQEKTDVNAECDTALSDYDGPTAAEMDAAHALLATAANLATVDGVADAIQAKTDNLPVDPADQSLIIAATEAIVADTEDIQSRLPAALVGGRMDCDIGAKTGNVALSSQEKTDVNAEMDTALADIHLDHLLATDTPTPLPGTAGSILHDLIEDDGGAWRFNANALEEGPGGGSGEETRLRTGTAQAGGANTITLDSGASGTDDYYKHAICALTGGTGAGQAQIIDSYVGATKVATMAASWATAPDNTTDFVILPLGTIPGASAPTAAQVADAVWDEDRADHDSSGSAGEALLDITASTAPTKKVADANTGQTTVYEEDGVTPRYIEELQDGSDANKVQVVRV